jgi:hypothetical protein
MHLRVRLHRQSDPPGPSATAAAAPERGPAGIEALDYRGADAAWAGGMGNVVLVRVKLHMEGWWWWGGAVGMLAPS